MRVIAGTARRTQLRTPEGLDTRPTTDRTKETLFNVLSPYVADAQFLDLYSGSGAIGIEALSRGAKAAVFSEVNKNALECIKSNLKATHLEEKARVITNDAISVVRQMETEGRRFDIVFMDPPFNHLHEKEILLRLDKSDIIDEDTVIVVEASNETTFEYLEGTSLTVYKEKKYKTNKHVFIEKR